MSKKRILLVGVSSGIGLLAADYVLQNDVIVYAAAPDIEPMRNLEAKGAKLITMDVTNTESVNAGVQQMVDAEGGIDTVLFNAGLHTFGPVEHTTEETAELLYQVNVMGGARVIRAVTPHMRKQRKGSIIFTCSIVSNLAIMCSGWYASTKHALKGLLSAFRQEVDRFGIDVVMIEPGQINTGFEQASFDKFRELHVDDDYKPMVKSVIGFSEQALEKSPGPEQTAKDICKAIMADKPSLVYRTSRDAKIMPFFKSLIGTKLFDRIITSEFKKYE